MPNLTRSVKADAFIQALRKRGRTPSPYPVEGYKEASKKGSFLAANTKKFEASSRRLSNKVSKDA